MEKQNSTNTKINQIEVTQQGMINRKFIVKNPKKIKFWTKLAEEVSPISTCVNTTIKELR